MIDHLVYCEKCVVYRFMLSPGVYACGKCGETTYGFVNDFVPNIWMGQKSRHSRRKYFKKCIEEVVGYQRADCITDDFMRVVRVVIDNNLLNAGKCRNMSKYGYYFIRLASRVGVPLVTTPTDLADGKTKKVYDDRLFGQVYKILGWDENCKCPYFLEWKRRNNKCLLLKLPVPLDFFSIPVV